MSEQMVVLPEDMFDDGPLPSVPQLVKERGFQRDQALEFLSALRSSREQEEEALISPDEHLSKLINQPLVEEIRRITEANRKLSEELKVAGATTERTPQEIEALIAENTKTLLNIKKGLAESRKADGQNGSSNITIDIGNIFQEALKGARDATIEA